MITFKEFLVNLQEVSLYGIDSDNLTPDGAGLGQQFERGEHIFKYYRTELPGSGIPVETCIAHHKTKGTCSVGFKVDNSTLEASPRLTILDKAAIFPTILTHLVHHLGEMETRNIPFVSLNYGSASSTARGSFVKEKLYKHIADRLGVKAVHVPFDPTIPGALPE